MHGRLIFSTEVLHLNSRAEGTAQGATLTFELEGTTRSRHIVRRNALARFSDLIKGLISVMRAL